MCQVQQYLNQQAERLTPAERVDVLCDLETSIDKVQSKIRLGVGNADQMLNELEIYRSAWNRIAKAGFSEA